MPTLIIDGDDTLWPAPIDGDLFPVAIIAKYIGATRPGHPVAAMAYDNVVPKSESRIYKWLSEHQKSKKLTKPKEVYAQMLADGSLGSRDDLMKEEKVYKLFLDQIEQAPMSFFYRFELEERGKKVAPILEMFDRVYLWTAATKSRAENTLAAMGVREHVHHIISAEDKLRKKDTYSFRKVKNEIAVLFPTYDIFFVDDALKYVENAQKAGLNAWHCAEFADPAHERLCKQKDIPCLKRLTDLPRVVPKSF